MHDERLFPNEFMKWWEDITALQQGALDVVQEETEEERMDREADENKDEQEEPPAGQPLAAAAASGSAVASAAPQPPPVPQLEVVMGQAKAASQTAEGPHAAVTAQDLPVPEETTQCVCLGLHVRMPASVTGPAPGSP